MNRYLSLLKNCKIKKKIMIILWSLPGWTRAVQTIN